MAFFVGYGCIGILPLLQLKLLWRFAPVEIIGNVLFVATFSVVISTFCDGNLSYKAVSAKESAEISNSLLGTYKVRFARLILLAPLAVLLFQFKGASILTSISIVLLSAAYLLNYAYIYRNSGSVAKALFGDFTLRALCQLCPVFGALLWGKNSGLVTGCLCAFLIQLIVVKTRFRIKAASAYPNFRAAISRDLFSGLLGLTYSSFCQTVSALVLSSEQFARFVSVDRLVRAGLLVTEPCRLWFLRQSWIQSSEFALGRIFAASLMVATASFLAVVMIFVSGLARYILHTGLSSPMYLGVSFFVSFVSFFTLCAFVRYNFIVVVNGILQVAIVLGAIAYWLLLGKGPFTASFAFEGVACLVVVAGSMLAKYSREA